MSTSLRWLRKTRTERMHFFLFGGSFKRVFLVCHGERWLGKAVGCGDFGVCVMVLQGTSSLRTHLPVPMSMTPSPSSVHSVSWPWYHITHRFPSSW